jgi:hypothetical protein
MIDLESGFGPTAAARRMPLLKGGRPMAPETIIRWITVGVMAPTGTRVRLEAVRLGRRWVTDSAAIARFVTALTASPAGQPGHRDRARRQRADEAAVHALESMGLATSSARPNGGGRESNLGVAE